MKEIAREEECSLARLHGVMRAFVFCAKTPRGGSDRRLAGIGERKNEASGPEGGESCQCVVIASLGLRIC